MAKTIGISKERQDRIAEILSDFIEREPAALLRIGLAEMGQYTIHKRDGTYSKRAMIGTEEFSISSVYFGKRGLPIYKLEPKFAADYECVEVLAKDLATKFRTFSTITATLINGLLAIEKEAEAEEEEAANAVLSVKVNRKMSERYGENEWGSW